MKKTILSLLSVLGSSVFALAGTYNLATPYVDATVKAGSPAVFDVLFAGDQVVADLKSNGQTVNDWRADDTERFLYIWNETFVKSETEAKGVGYSGLIEDEFPCLNVASVGWSGAGLFVPSVNTTHWTDETRIHIAYSSQGVAPASVAFIVADNDNYNTPAKVAVGTNFNDGGNIYPSVGDASSSTWQAIDISFAELKTVYPTFQYQAVADWKGNLLSFLAGGATGNNISLDAVYFYTPQPVYNTAYKVDPANNSVLASMGTISIEWPKSLVAEDSEGDVSYDNVKVLVDGVENTAWKSDMGAMFKATNLQTSNEQFGGLEGEEFGALVFSAGDMAFFWKGEVSIEIAPGVVTFEDGSVNPPISLTYNVAEAIYGATFNPAEGAKFNVGEGLLWVSWPDAEATSYATGERGIFVEPKPSGERIYLGNALGVYDGKLKVSLASLPAGSYDLTIPEGGVILSENGTVKVSGEAYYSFSVGYGEGPAITPAPGLYPNFNNSTVRVIWPESAVTEATGFTGNITLKLDGTVCDPDNTDTPWSWAFVDAYGWDIWEGDDTPAAGIRITVPYVDTENINTWTYNIEIPAGMFTITDSKNVTSANTALSLEYKGINFNDDVTADPEKGSMLKSLKEFTFSFDNYKNAVINPNCLYNATYGWEETAVTVTEEGNGEFKVTLPETLISNGWVSINFPEGYFNITTEYGVVASPSFEISYQLSLYTTDPADFSDLFEPIYSFSIYSENITVVGELSDIVLKDGMKYDEDGEYVVIGHAESYKAVTNADDMPGLEFTFDAEEYETSSIQIVVPAGTLAFDGTVFDQDITINCFLKLPVPAPTVTPEDNTTVGELATVTLSWKDSPLYLSWVWEDEGSTPFTLTINDGTPIDITENVEIESEIDDSYGFEIPVSSKLVITFDPAYRTDGTYVIYVPANYVEVEDYGYECNEAITLTYIVSEKVNVGSLVAPEEGSWKVYTINGILVLDTDDEGALATLPSGLYIINGKKVIVR